jgi:hypothetical protein
MRSARSLAALGIACALLVALDRGAAGPAPSPTAKYASLPQRLALLSRAAVEQQARAALRPEALVVVVVGDRQQVEAELRSDEVIVESATPQLLR